MNKHRMIALLGVLVAITPSVGFPSSWEENILLVLGIILFIVAILLMRERKIMRMMKDKEAEEIRKQNFAQNMNSTHSENIIISSVHAKLSQEV